MNPTVVQHSLNLPKGADNQVGGEDEAAPSPARLLALPNGCRESLEQKSFAYVGIGQRVYSYAERIFLGSAGAGVAGA